MSNITAKIVLTRNLTESCELIVTWDPATTTAEEAAHETLQDIYQSETPQQEIVWTTDDGSETEEYVSYSPMNRGACNYRLAI